jgi:hypothetical protein
MSRDLHWLHLVVSGRTTELAQWGEDKWRGLSARAEEEGVEGLFYQRCRAAGIPLPADIEENFQVVYRETAEQNFVALEELREVLEGLQEDSAAPLVLPGASLLALYPDLGCRPMDDIDILVPPGSGTRLKEGLQRCGFASPARHDELFVRGRLTLDLHDDLLNCGRIGSRRHAGWMEPGEVWCDRREVRVEGIPMIVMCREDMVLFTAVHALRHCFGRFTWFVDLHFLVQEPLDWECLRGKAERYRLERPLLYGLRFLRDWLQVELPERGLEWLEAIRLPPLEERLMDRAFVDRSRGEWGDLLWSFSATSRWRQCLFLAETFFPKPSVLLQVFPRLPLPLFPLAYVLRMAQLLARGVRQLAELVRSR